MHPYFNNTNQATSHSSESSLNHERPTVQVPPRGIGPVTTLTENDVLCGRGGRINGHAGNIQFRRICGEKRDEYYKSNIKKIEKAHIAARVVEHIRSMTPPGRFLKQDAATGHWYDIGDAKAMTKVGQAIREHMPREGEEEFTVGTTHAVTDSFSHEPLYPGYQPLQLHSEERQQHDAKPMMTRTYQEPSHLSLSNKTAAENYHANRMVARDHQQAMDVPTQAQVPSGFSNMSIVSGLSDFFKSNMAPTVSATTDGQNSANRRPSTISSLLRESILSDMSDGDFDESVYQETYFEPGLSHAPHANQLENLQETSENMVDQQVKRLRHGRKRSSLMSIATVSSISDLSIGSGKWGKFNF